MRVEPKVTIQNVVASARFEQRFDLKAIVRSFPFVEYRSERFPGLVFRLSKPKTATLIFTTGKMVCTGAKSEKEAKRSILKVARELKKAGIIILGKPEITIHNIVASVDLGDVMVDLERVIYTAYDFGMKVMYEPDQFPGAILRMKDPKVVFLIFSSGKLVCAGAKRENDIHRAVAEIVAFLDKNSLISWTGEATDLQRRERRSNKKDTSMKYEWKERIQTLIPEPSMKFTYPRGVSFACDRCGMCCEDTDSKARTILLLRTEAKHISKETSRDLDEFVERIEDLEPYVYQMRKTSDWKCVFLKHNSCSIYKIRPLTCRLYPFQLKNLGHNKFVFSCTNEYPNVGKGRRLDRRFFERLFAKFLESMNNKLVYRELD